MKDGASNDPAQDMRWDENDPNDPVWRLLAQAPRREPDAWFTIRTMALCREQARAWRPRFAGLWRWALGGGLAAFMAVALVVNQTAQVQPDQSVQPDKQKNVQEAFEIMASIDTDSDSSSSSPSSWQDSSL